MSISMKVVEFEKREAHLSSELEQGPPYTVHGIALGAGDVTRGASGIEKFWPGEELEAAAETLQGKNLVEDHENSSRGVVGKVTKAGYKEGVGVLYEAELFDRELAERISNGLLEVSIRGYHKDVDEMEETEEGAKIVEDIEFDNLSIVPQGASPSNTLEMGATSELSVAALSSYVSTLQEEEETEIEPGMWVKWSGGKGVTISPVEDGEIEVDVYEEADGTWRSTGSTEMVSVNSLSEWDVDEDSIGSMEEDSEEESEEESEEDEEAENEEHDSEDEPEEEPEEEEAPEEPEPPEFADGDWVQWQVNPAMFGKVVHVDDEEEMKVMVEVMTMQDGEPVSTGHTVSAGFTDLNKMEVGSMEENTSITTEEIEETAEIVEEASEHGEEEDEEAEMVDVPEEHLFDEREDAVEMAEEMGISGAHQMDDKWMPGGTHEEYMDAVSSMSAHGDEEEDEEKDEEEMAAEGEEEVDKSKENQPWRYPDEDGDPDDNEVEELQEYSMHEPDWSGTTESEWSSPDMEDFDTDDLGEIASHFLISSTGFPPENFTDLKLPVVEPNGDLNVNALAAVKGGRGVSAVDGLSSDMEEGIVNWVNETANDEFDKNWGMDEEENNVTGRNVPSDDPEPTHKMDPEVEDDRETEMTSPVECALDLINVYLRGNGHNERDSLDKMVGWLFGTTDVPTEEVEAFRTAANAFLTQQGGVDSFDAVSVEQFRDWLLTQGGQTDDGKHARYESPEIATPVYVLSGDDLQKAYTGASEKADKQDTNMTDIEEELSELDEPVAVEKNDFEELQEKADRFEDMSENLEALRERTEVLDSVDREKIDELAESDDPMVLETAEFEELSAEAEQVKKVYAEALSHEGPFSADDLVDKFSIEELREKYEDIGGDLEEELSPEPKSGDVDEEELEEKAEEENESTEELEAQEEIAERQAELREKILGGN